MALSSPNKMLINTYELHHYLLSLSHVSLSFCLIPKSKHMDWCLIFIYINVRCNIYIHLCSMYFIHMREYLLTHVLFNCWMLLLLFFSIFIFIVFILISSQAHLLFSLICSYYFCAFFSSFNSFDSCFCERCKKRL